MRDANQRRKAQYTAEQARGGRVVLRLTVERAIFIIGLVVAIAFALIAGGHPR